MQALSEEVRTRNITGRDHCRFCGDDAQVVVAIEKRRWKDTEASYEQMGPCPHCERGYRLEYGADSPWKPDGYWQGRELPAHLTTLHVA
jgi:hypothetical protein